MQNGNVNPTVKYVVRSIIGFILLIFGLYAIVAGLDVTDDMIKLVVVLYGAQQSVDGFFTVKTIRNGNSK